MENLTYQPSAEHVAACGLYCGACRKFVKRNGVKYGRVISSTIIRVVQTVQSVLSTNARSSIIS